MLVFNQNQEAQHFSFLNYVQTAMGLNYFEIPHVKNANALLHLSKNDISVIKCVLLATKISDSDYYCCTMIINNWLILDKCGSFKVMDGFKYNE